MPVTRIADIINPQVLMDQVSAKFPTELVFAATPGVINSTDVPLGFPGTQVTLPGWKRMPGMVPKVEGTPGTTNKIQALSEIAVVLRAFGAWEVEDTASLVSAADPMAEIEKQLNRIIAEYLDDSLITVANNTPNLHDITSAGSNTLSVDVLIDALITKLGDQYNRMTSGGVIVMHSKQSGDLMKLGLIQQNQQSNMNFVLRGQIGTLLGMPVLTSDRVTTATVSGVNHYNAYVCAPGSLGLFYQADVRIEFERDVLALTDIIAASMHFAPHLYGYNEASSTVTAEDNRSIGVVRIKTR